MASASRGLPSRRCSNCSTSSSSASASTTSPAPGAARVPLRALAGCSLTALASRAGITKQAMGKLVDQCAAWDLVQRLPDPRDARAMRVVFTPSGQLWLAAYQQAVQQAEAEFRQAVGGEVATVVQLGLEVYAS